MAVRLEGSIQRWIGFSSDRKPGLGVDSENVTTAPADIPVGSSFLESDTGRIFRWTGTTWVAPMPDDRVVELLTQIVDELHRQRLMQESALDVSSDDYL